LFLDWPFFVVGVVYGFAFFALGFSLVVRSTHLSDAPARDVPARLAPDHADDRGNDWRQFCEEIETMLKSGAYDFADDSLRKMQASIARYKVVTSGQQVAIKNLKAAKSRSDDQFSG
jgi:hypothetical protein